MTVRLYRAREAEDSYAIQLETDAPESWRAEKGFGKHFQHVWSVELQGLRAPNLSLVDWEAVLERVIEAYELNDPVIVNYSWPLARAGQRPT